jgi:peptide chain release factor 1
MFEKLEAIERRYEELEGEMAKPETIANLSLYKQLAVEHAELRELVDDFRVWRRLSVEAAKTLALLETESDEEMRALIREEGASLEAERDRRVEMLRDRLLSKEDKHARSMFLEIRAGTGGEEAALFAADLFSMYMKYAESKRWKTELMGESISGLGGFKEVVVLVESKDAFPRLRYESGVHRVQRVPETEAQGRIHTSTVTVAVLTEPEELEVAVNPDELRIDVFRSSGPGGQHVNTTDSAVRITHLPTGIVVTCQDEKSQHKNKAKAMRVLRARLKDKMEAEKEQEISAERRKQVGTGDRSERIRTYNFPQGRVTDHRIGLTLYKLQDVMNGDLDDLVNPLTAHFQAEALRLG